MLTRRAEAATATSATEAKTTTTKNINEVMKKPNATSLVITTRRIRPAGTKKPHMSVSTLVMILVASASVASAFREVIGLTYALKKDILYSHNYFREKEVETQGAVNMRLMEWDERLEKFASKYVQQCTFQHSNSIDRNAAGRGPGEHIGENIYLSSEHNLRKMSDVVETWYREIDHYNYDTRECAPRYVCDHYTQVVWNDTYRLGCGLEWCADGWMLMCNYGPAGNVIYENSTNAREPYSKGKYPCQGCSFNATMCVGNLCAEERQYKEGLGLSPEPISRNSRATPRPTRGTLCVELWLPWAAIFTNLLTL